MPSRLNLITCVKLQRFIASIAIFALRRRLGATYGCAPYRVATDEEGVALLQAALQKLTRSVSEAVAAETAQYFEGVKVPDVNPGKRG